MNSPWHTVGFKLMFLEYRKSSDFSHYTERNVRNCEELFFPIWNMNSVSSPKGCFEWEGRCPDQVPQFAAKGRITQRYPSLYPVHHAGREASGSSASGDWSLTSQALRIHTMREKSRGWGCIAPESSSLAPPRDPGILLIPVSTLFFWLTVLCIFCCFQLKALSNTYIKVLTFH